MSESTFGAWMKDWLRRKRWSQRKFADESGFDASSVSRWLRAEGDPAQRTPDPVTIKRIAEVTGTKEEFLMVLAGHVSPPDADSSEMLEVIAVVRSISWTPERFEAAMGMLRAFQAHSDE